MRWRVGWPDFPNEQWRVLSPYLDQALEISPDQRAAWLAELKEQNPALAAELQVLLQEHRALVDEGFLQAGAPAPPKAPSLSGQAVGAYTLESPLGQGGMGSYLALGRSLSALGKKEQAHAPLRAAVEQMQSTLGPDHAETRSARQLAEK